MVENASNGKLESYREVGKQRDESASTKHMDKRIKDIQGSGALVLWIKLMRIIS